MYYSAPNEKVHVLPWDFSAFEKLPAKSEVIIQVLNSALDKAEVERATDFFTGREISIISLVMKFGDFQSFLSGYLSTIAQNSDIIISEAGSKKDFIGLINRLKAPHFRFILPLRNDSDRLNIKILSSAGVRVLIDLRDPALDWAQLDDLITDQLLNIAPRADLEPFSMLSKVYKTKEFDLSTVYYASPVDFIHYDPAGGVFNNVPAELIERNVNEKIIKGEKCAFCAGFYLCKGFLEPHNRGIYEHCSGFFSSLFDALEIKASKEEIAAKK